MNDNDAADLRERVAEVKGSVDTLNVRINGSLDKISNHIQESVKFRDLIVKLVYSSVIQGFSVAFMAGMAWLMISSNAKAIEKHHEYMERVQQHIIKDESRWDVFDIKKGMQK